MDGLLGTLNVRTDRGGEYAIANHHGRTQEIEQGLDVEDTVPAVLALADTRTVNHDTEHFELSIQRQVRQVPEAATDSYDVNPGHPVCGASVRPKSGSDHR